MVTYSNKRYDILFTINITMIFKWNPLEAFSLSRLVQFNHIGEFTTEDEALIKEMTEKWFETAEWQAKPKKKVKTEGKEETKEDGDLASLREEYKNKTGKKPFWWRTAEQIKEKMAE